MLRRQHSRPRSNCASGYCSSVSPDSTCLFGSGLAVLQSSPLPSRPQIESSRPLQESGQLAADRTAETGTGIPAGSRGEAVVVAFGDVVETPRGCVELWIEIANRTTFEL